MPKTEIDPQLPYIQVHRSVGAMAAQLAPLLAVTYQHARGALDVFWESLADRRILARALLLPEPMVLLDDLECRQRLQLAFGAKVEPQLMATVGALEVVQGSKWRVRGMSRYLETERGRREWTEKSAKGGRTRAAGPRQADGKLMVQPPASHLPADEPATVHAKDERREVRGESEEVRGDQSAPLAAERLKPSPVSAPTSDPVAWLAEDFWRWAESKRQAAGCPPQAPPHSMRLSVWWSEALGLLNGDVKRMQEAFYRFGEDKHWQDAQPALPFGAFMAKWNDFLPVRRHAQA